MPTFHIDPEQSWVWIEASTSLHRFRGQANGLHGTITAERNGSGLDLSTPPRISLELAVERLRAGTRFEQAELMRRIDARRYPKIRGEVRDIRPASGTGRYRVRGDISFHGTTRSVEGDIVVHCRDDQLVVEGEHIFDIRDYDLQPPKLLMVKVHPEVKVRVRVVARAGA